MNVEEEFDRFRYRTRVQAVAVIDILVGTIPFINLAFDFNNKDLADLYPEREMLVLFWSILLCVYVLQLIMGIWLLAATREVYSEYTVGNCQVWFYVAMFSFFFYTGEMAYDISQILNDPPQKRSAKQVLITMSYHAAKIIYRAFTLMIVNNFLYDICRPVQRFLSQGSFQYKYYCSERLGIPLRLPSRRANFAARFQSMTQSQYPVQTDPNFSYYSTYPQPRSKQLLPNNISNHNYHPPRLNEEEGGPPLMTTLPTPRRRQPHPPPPTSTYRVPGSVKQQQPSSYPQQPYPPPHANNSHRHMDGMVIRPI